MKQSKTKRFIDEEKKKQNYVDTWYSLVEKSISKMN